MANEAPAPELTGSERHQVAEVWATRAEAERSAHRRFSRIAGTLSELGAPAVVQELAERAVDDEARHATLCEEVARSYGLTRALGEGPEDALAALPDLSPVDQLLVELVGFCCIQETLNASLLVETLQHATVPSVRKAVQEILADEVHHARLGWATLTWARGEGHGNTLSHYLPGMMRSLGTALLEGSAEASPGSDALLAHGELPARMRAQIFEATMTQVVARGLQREGVDTAGMTCLLEAWKV